MKMFSKRLIAHLKSVHGSTKKAKEWLETQTSNFTFKRFSEMDEVEIINELRLSGHLL